MLDAADRAQADTRMRASRVVNRGRVRAITRDLTNPGQWLITTREQTTSVDGSYEGVGPQWHLTVATVRRLPGGRYAVASWSPQT